MRCKTAGEFLSILVNPAALFGIGARLWTLVERPVTLALTVAYLDPVQQGYLVAFANVLGFSSLIELGLTTVLTQHFSHLQVSSVFKKESFDLLLRAAFRYFCGAALLVLFLVGFSGNYFFRTTEIQGANWFLPWWIYVAASASAILLVPFTSAMLGTGESARVQLINLVAAIVGGVLTWISLKTTSSLHCIWLLPAVQIIVWLSYLAARKRTFLVSAIQTIQMEDFRRQWKEIWPMQWRIAVSWIAGTIVFNSAVPTFLAVSGPVEAGRYGLTVNLCSFLQNVAITPIVVAAPKMANLVATSSFVRLDQWFKRALIVTLVLLTAGSIGLWATATRLHVLAPSFEGRLLTQSGIALVVGINFVNTVLHAIAIYLRSYRREPFLIVSCVSAVGTLALLRFVGAISGVYAFLQMQGIFLALVVLPLSVWVFYTSRKSFQTGI